MCRPKLGMSNYYKLILINICGIEFNADLELKMLTVVIPEVMQNKGDH